MKDVQRVGVDASVMERLLPTSSAATAPPEPIRRLSEQGAHGHTSGRGFYPYSPEDARRWEMRLHQRSWRLHELMTEDAPGAATNHATRFMSEPRSPSLLGRCRGLDSNHV